MCGFTRMVEAYRCSHMSAFLHGNKRFSEAVDAKCCHVNRFQLMGVSECFKSTFLDTRTGLVLFSV